ncbi:MAG: c-type cytochrome [bacterium]|nr:c-type cytochrome [bacterium]
MACKQPEVTPAQRGQKIAHELGCFGCHGAQGIQGIPDPTAPGGRVPGWDLRTAEMYIGSRDDIRQWILHGAPDRDTANGVPPSNGNLVPMPAYDGHISGGELEDLVEYFIAASGWSPDIPEAAYEGRKIAVRLGCFGCHGPSGMGGVPNPGSFKGHIPAWDGDEYAEVVHDEEELRDWILQGKPPERLKNLPARFFLERQKLRMPAYREHLSDDELKKLAAYIRWLREE